MKRLIFLLLVVATHTCYGNTRPVETETKEDYTVSDNFDFIKEIMRMYKKKKLNQFFFVALIGFLQKEKDVLALNYLNVKLEQIRDVKNSVIVNKLQCRIEKAKRYIQEHSGLPIL